MYTLIPLSYLQLKKYLHWTMMDANGMSLENNDIGKFQFLHME